MRPIKITISAFGPYAGTQVIDFRDLNGRNFFLIHGRTGAGKTSLLDAMCFALYGDSSGDERAGRDMRSHHADASVRTEVVFDFAVGQEMYRVARSPQQERPRKKGGGLTIEQAQGTLWCRNDVLEDTDDGKVLASQPNKVTSEIEKLLNFQSSQFRQVVILPQGQFRRLLMAESIERQEILEALFKTEIYRRIEEALKAASKEIKDKWSEAGTKSEVILRQADVATYEELLALHKAVAAEREVAQAAVSTSQLRLDTCQERLTVALQAEQVLKELALAESALEALKQQASDFEERRLRLKGAQEAARLIPSETILNQRRTELAAARSKAQSADSALKEALRKRDSAVLAVNQEEGREPEREELRRSIRQLSDLSGRVDEFQKANNELRAAELKSRSLLEDKEKLSLAIELGEKSLDVKLEQFRKMESTATMLEANRQMAQAAEKVLQSRRSLDAACEELTQTTVEAELARVAFQKEEAELLSYRKSLEQLERSWLFGQAAILALQLVDGNPCPVCGSADHPNPASSQAVVPTELELNRQRDLLAAKEANKDDANKRKFDWEGSVAKLQSQVHALTETLGDDAFIDLPLLQKRIRETNAAVLSSQEAASDAQTVKKEIDELKTMHARSKEKLALLEVSVEAENSRRFQLSGIVKEKESIIPEELRDTVALQARLNELTGQLKDLELKLKTAQLAAGEANQLFASCEADHRNAVELEAGLFAIVESAITEFQLLLTRAGFADEELYRSSRLSSADLLRLEQEIQNFDSGFRLAEERACRARETANKVEVPDLIALQAELGDAKNINQDAVRTAAELEAKLKYVDGYVSEFEQSKQKSLALEKEFECFGRISEVANGNNGRKLTFQRYVLGALLDDVLLAASERLTIMSQGRYRLQRVCGTTDLRKAGGLELEVLDSYTGTTRAAATLSGGESFLASMSLALGLADVVQSYAGGIHLETMFIDEGFGSLDPESLDFAIRALRDLQKSGRLVGIISHVPELQERIDARLEVVPCAQGSVASFKFG